MLVAYLLGQFPTVSNTFVYREIDSLRQHGVDVDVYALSQTKESNHELVGMDSIRWVPSAHAVVVADAISDELSAAWLSHSGRKKDLRRARWLARQWRKRGVTCVHAHFAGFEAAVAALACSIADIPLVITVHARGVFVPNSFSRFALRRAASILSISNATHDAVKAYSGRDSLVLPLPIEAAKPSPACLKPLHVLSVGRAVEKKGHRILREALSRLDVPYTWTVAGAHEWDVGGRMDGLNALGPVPFAEIEAVYGAGVDVFALACCESTDGDMDGIPVAILEAMARGVTVVSTAVGGIPELIQSEETGLLVAPQDPHALVAAIRRVAVDHDLRTRLARNGRLHVLSSRSVTNHVRTLTHHLQTVSA